MEELPNGDNPPNDDDREPRKVRMSNVTARLPPSVAEGVLSTGAIVFNGQTEIVIDFIQQMGPSGKVVARVVMPKPTVSSFATALEQNLDNYTSTFGAPPELPKGSGQQRPIQEVYDDLKMPDEDLSGHYANMVAIRHTPAEFAFDFIAKVFPNSAVSARVFLTPSRVRAFLDSLKKNCGLSDDEKGAENGV